MDVISLIGAMLGLAVIFAGHALEGGTFSGLLNLPALVVVLGGTLAASLVQTPLPVLRHAWQLSAWLLHPPKLQPALALEKVLHWSEVSRREGLGGLKRLIAFEEEGLSKKALGLLVGGFEPEAIRKTLESDLAVMEYRTLQAAKVFDTMGGYAPTLGIMGAVLGLIQVMGSLDDPERLGSGIATAFVATLYGVGLANLVLLPVGNKLKCRVYEFIQISELVIEGVVSIANGEHPRTIDLRLSGLSVETRHLPDGTVSSSKKS